MKQGKNATISGSTRGDFEDILKWLIANCGRLGALGARWWGMGGKQFGAKLPDWEQPSRPDMRPIDGNFLCLVALDADAHAADLPRAKGTDDAICDDLPYGPFASAASYLRIAPEAGSIEVGHINIAPERSWPFRIGQTTGTGTASLFWISARISAMGKATSFPDVQASDKASDAVLSC